MKKLSVLLVLALLLSLLAGCQTQTPASTAAPETAKPSTSTRPSQPNAAPETSAAPVVDPDAVHPMLFRVTGENGQEMYLFGTIHVGDARTKTALEKLKPFLDGCGALAVEFDVVAFEKDTTAQMKSVTQFVLTDGSTVESYMPAELYEQSSALLEQAGLKPELTKYYNLAMWSQLVEQAALLTKCSLDMNAGMDRYLINYCYEKQIPVRDVESAEFQYGLMASFSDELNLLKIESTMKNLDDYGTQVDALYASWVEGNYDHILAVIEEEDSDETEELTEEQKKLVEAYNDAMLTQRNLGMRDKAVQWLTAGDKVFFAVGAAHLVGEGGLVELLRSAGYSVEQLSY